MGWSQAKARSTAALSLSLAKTSQGDRPLKFKPLFNFLFLFFHRHPAPWLGGVLTGGAGDCSYGGSLGLVYAEKICKIMDKAMLVGAPVSCPFFLFV